MPKGVSGGKPQYIEQYNDTGKIGGKWKAPKSGTNTMCQQYGKQYCKGICGGLSNKGKRGAKLTQLMSTAPGVVLMVCGY